MQKLLPETKPVEYRSSWILSWGTGNQSYQLAKTLEHNGAVPIGTVAVPVKRDGKEQFLHLFIYFDININNLCRQLQS
jgi:hypothetical protein